MWLDQGRSRGGGGRETGAGTRNFIFCNFRDNVILSTTFCLTSPSVASQHLQLQEAAAPPPHPPPPATLPTPTCSPTPLYIRNLLCALGTLTLDWMAVSGWTRREEGGETGGGEGGAGTVAGRGRVGMGSSHPGSWYGATASTSPAF